MAKGGFRGGMPGGNMMKQAQKMQEEFMKMQQELESKEFVSTVGGGAVKATMIGTRALKSIEIDPSAVDPDVFLQILGLRLDNRAFVRTCGLCTHTPYHAR